MQKILQRIIAVQGADSVSAFARRIGIKQQTLDCYIKGTRKPSLELILCICSRCGISADWLLGLSPERAPAAAPATSSPIGGDAAEIARLREEVANLKGEIKGLRYALDSQGKPAAASGAGARHTA